MLTAKQMAEKDHQRQSVKKETYKVILEQFMRKIKANFELNLKTTLVTVPPFVVGYPRYDMHKALTYLTRQLVRLGYRVERTGPFDLEISWSVKTTTPEIVSPDVEFPSLVNLKKIAKRYAS